MYVAMTGDSGQGKNSSSSASRTLMPCDIHVAKLGSGEGIVHQYAWRERGSDELQWYKRSILFESGEAETLQALITRTSSTLAGEIRSAWMGEAIGFGYSDVRKRLVLPERSYRMSLLSYFTPSMGNVLLDGIAEGTPQRFLFLPIEDPDLPDEDDVREPRRQLDINLPSVDEDALIEVKVPGWIRRQIRDDHRVKVRRRAGSLSDAELLDTHFNLVRLKVALALGIMFGSDRQDYRITRDDWDLSGFVMDKHRETREWLVAAAEAEGHKKDRKEGKSLGIRYAASDEVRKLGPVTDRIIAILTVAKKKGKNDGWMSGGNIRNLMSDAQRKIFDEAMPVLISSGKVESKEEIVAKTASGTRPLTLRFRLVK